MNRRFVPLMLLALAASLAACGRSALPVSTARPGLLPGALSLPGFEQHLSGELQLHVLPEATDAPILRAIAGARKSVRLEVYMLTHRGVMDALVNAKARGLDVQVLLEEKPYNPGNPSQPLPTNKQAAATLEKAGVAVRWTSDAFRYTHAKELIIDDAVAYVSTANFTKSGLGMEGKGSREYIVADRSPSDVAEFVAMFQADWAHQPYTPTDEDLIVSPANSRQKILALVASARHEIALQVEVAGDPAFDQAIAARLKQGVRVRALLADLATLKSANVRSNGDVAKSWRALGAQVRFQGQPHLHAKAIVVDGQTLYVGSVNLTTNSMDGNRELGLLVKTPELVKTVQQTIEKDWATALETPTKQ